MQIQLLMVVLLASWSQAGGVEHPLATYAVRVPVGDNHGIRDITLEPVAPPARDNEDGEDLPALLKDRILNIAVVERENFDRWLFADHLTGRARQARLEQLLKEKIEATAWEYRLTEPQKAKLRLAGSGDIKRFFDEAEDRRAAFETQRKSYKAARVALLGLDDLSRRYRMGPFGDGSLFAKALHRINAYRRVDR